VIKLTHSKKNYIAMFDKMNAGESVSRQSNVLNTD